jgi:uncharacterized protein (TIGR00369 family)
MATHPTRESDGAAQTLAEWLELEAQVRAAYSRGPGCGVIPPDKALASAGLDLMQGMLRGELPYPPIGVTLDFLLVQAERGMVAFQGTPGAGHLNPLGSVHGGWFATLLDSALGCAVQTTLSAGQGYTTTDLNIKLVRALSPQVPRVRAVAQVVHVGRQLATAEGRLIGPDGKLYAHGSTSCLIFDARR